MTAKMQAPVRLKKITTRYDKVEDRMRLDAQLDGETPQSFWLTQRLCRELVRTMAQYFNQSGLAVSDSSPQSQGAVQRFFHESAQSGKKKTAPVASRPRAVLLDRVQVRTTDKAVQLLLPLSDDRTGALVFSPDEARQWLEILYQQYRAAEWPLDIWPEWIRGEGGPGPARTKAVH